MNEPTLFSTEFIKRNFNVDESNDRVFAEQLLTSLINKKSAVFEPHVRHPFAAKIAEGKSSLSFLLTHAEYVELPQALDALDAIAFIIKQHSADEKSINKLRSLLHVRAEIEIKAAIAQNLALAQDKDFLREQINNLSDEDPGVVGAAAELLGYGHFQEATLILCQLISPSRFFESRQIIWSLGEIGSIDASPYLHRCIREGFRVNDALIALGKIGAAQSVPLILSHALSVGGEQRDIAFRSLAEIFAQLQSSPEIIAILADDSRPMIESLLARDLAILSWDSRAYMLLCLARLGKTMHPSLIRKYLELSILPNNLFKPNTLSQTIRC